MRSAGAYEGQQAARLKEDGSFVVEGAQIGASMLDIHWGFGLRLHHGREERGRDGETQHHRGPAEGFTTS